LGSKWPELLKESAPAVERIGLLFNPDTAPYAESFLRHAEASASSSGVKLTASRFQNDFEIERTIAELASAPGGGLIVLPDPLTNTRSALIIGLAAKHRVPALYAWRFQAFGGGLISYGVDLAESFRLPRHTSKKAGQPARTGADQILPCRQSQDREDARPNGADGHLVTRY
jgi:putative ABC transport system substrate-binding protein